MPTEDQPPRPAAACSTCLSWTIARRTLYGDGSIVDNYRAAAGRGGCGLLGIETTAGFGCNQHQPAPAGFTHLEDAAKPGAPWQHSVAGPCPDCVGNGNAGDRSCHRCAGTGKVRHYDDGFVGEERTRLHPRERELMAKPRCAGCDREVEVEWKVCPSCGHKLDAVAETEKVGEDFAELAAPGDAQ